MKASDLVKYFLLLTSCLIGGLSLHAKQRPLSDSTAINLLIDSVQNNHGMHLETAIRLLDSTLVMSREAGFVIGELKSLSLLGSNINSTGDYQAAIDTIELAMEIAVQLERPATIAILKTRLARCYLPLGYYQISMALFLEAQKVFEELDHKPGEASCAVNLAIIYSRMRDTVASFASHRHALNLALEIGNLRGVTTTNINMSLLFSEQEEFDSSWARIMAAEKVILERHFYENEGYLHTAKSVYYKKKKDFKQSEAELRLALINYRKLKLPFRIAGSWVHIGFAQLKQKQYRKATQSLKKGLVIGEELQAPEIQKTALLHLSQAYEGLGEFRNALDASRKFQAINRDKLAPELNSELERVRTKYTVEKKDRELAQLELGLEQKRVAVEQQDINLERQELALSRGRMRLWLSLGGLALLGIFAIFLGIKNRDNRRHSKLQAEKQALTASSLAEKEVLLGEIHHRVKNNLQMVYNMLDLQSRQLTEDAGKQAIRDSMNRVSTMALIHQKLYQQENVSGVHMAAYLDHLLNSLYMSFAESGQEIELQQDVEDLLLDINSAIPIGLIINELVTNAFKYAYSGKQDGILRLHFRHTGDSLLLEVADNGPGIPAEYASGFGLSMVRSLARQLKATWSVNGKDGTLVRLEIQKFKLIHA